MTRKDIKELLASFVNVKEGRWEIASKGLGGRAVPDCFEEDSVGNKSVKIR